MSTKTVTIPYEKYEHLKQTEDLAHRQRFRIRHLERKLERHKAFSSRFLKRTLWILQGSGYSMEEIMLMYGDPGKDVLWHGN